MIDDTPQASETTEQREFIELSAFSVSARVALQLGRESISSSVTAILELVKNAYDADAEEVRIRFHALGTSVAMMVIQDNGRGMTAAELRENWMVIGTDSKARDRKSKTKHRALTGEKGLGRLGLDRLCGRTRVQSVTAASFKAVELEIDWAKYEETNSRLEEITHPFFHVPHLRRDPVTGEAVEFEQGTRLILDDLKDRWDVAALKELHRELSLLVSPFHAVNDFRVVLETGGICPDVDGEVGPNPTVLESAGWKVTGTVDENSIVEVWMTSPSPREVEEFREKPTKWEDFVKGEGEIALCGALKFEFYFFNISETDGEDQSLSRGDVRNFLKNNQGIRIYRDGFRVKPYGEPNGEGDWLRLGYRRTLNPEGVRQARGRWKVGYNQVVGAVFITREQNPALSDQTNREGLVIGDAFRHLYIFADKMIGFFERHREQFEQSRPPKTKRSAIDPEKSRESSEVAASALKELTGITQRLESLAGAPNESVAAPVAEDVRTTLDRVNKKLAQAVSTFEETIRQSASQLEESKTQKDTMANLASLGILAACFGHETRGWANTVFANAGWLERNLKKKTFMVLPDVEAEISQILVDLGTDSKKLETFAAFALGNVRPDKRKRTQFCVKAVALEVFGAFRGTFQTQKCVQADTTEVPAHECRIRAYRIDWESIFANLIANGLWAMSKTKSDRRIRLTITEEPSQFVLTFDDAGCGLEAGTEEQIFDAGFSTKRDARGEQEGTGMGLYIVKSFVEENSGGTIRAVAKTDLGGAGFVITVPRAEPAAASAIIEQ